MKKEDFDNLLTAAKQFKDLKDNKIKPSRVFDYSFDVKEIRNSFKMSQAEFAAFLSVPKKTILNWEQGRSIPTGAAQSLLKVAKTQPQALISALHSN